MRYILRFLKNVLTFTSLNACEHKRVTFTRYWWWECADCGGAISDNYGEKVWAERKNYKAHS